MIRNIIERIFLRKIPDTRQESVVIGKEGHGIRCNCISNGSRTVVETLQRHGYKAYIVGGAVRDLLTSISPKDFDVVTSATPEQVRKCFRRARIIGRRFQIVHVLMGPETVEVTTFRGHHTLWPNTKVLAFQTDENGRVVRDNVFGSQKDDAARRDFTINAFYYDPVSEAIIDYHNGLGDLREKRLRIIGDPKTRYREDPVRMLRAVRLAAKLGFSIDPATREPISELSDLIVNVPPSRLFDETLKLFTSGQAVNCVVQLRAEGLHQSLLPLLDVVLEKPQGERFVMLALKKTDERIREGKPVSPGFLFAALLWHEVMAKWKYIQASGSHSIPALYLAMDEVLNIQTEKLAIAHRITSDIKDILALQPRFEQRSGKRPFALLLQMRFKASYDFLLLRIEAGEVDEELGQWWTKFMHSNQETRMAMLLPAKSKQNRKKRRSKHKPRITKISN